MKIPKHLKRAIDEEGSLYTEIVANAEMPSLLQFGAWLVNVRDDIAKTADIIPEEVQLIGVKVFYKIGQESDGDGAYYALGTRVQYDPVYLHVLQEIGE
jgi:hypothetical protein